MPASTAVLVVGWITLPCFWSSAETEKNGFVEPGTVSSRPFDETVSRKHPLFQSDTVRAGDPRQSDIAHRLVQNSTTRTDSIVVQWSSGRSFIGPRKPLAPAQAPIRDVATSRSSRPGQNENKGAMELHAFEAIFSSGPFLIRRRQRLRSAIA